jgi:hypothetical protein
VPGPITLRLIGAWNKMVGIDIVDQALSHLEQPERDRLTICGTVKEPPELLPSVRR